MAISDGVGVAVTKRTSRLFKEDDLVTSPDGNCRRSTLRTTDLLPDEALHNNTDKGPDTTCRASPSPNIINCEVPTSDLIACDPDAGPFVDHDERVVEGCDRATALRTGADLRISIQRNADGDSTPLWLPSSRPVNFGEVVPGVYRSSYPKPHHYEFIKGLDLKCIV
jgi:tyrosine-protein phosphatase SIW14